MSNLAEQKPTGPSYKTTWVILVIFVLSVVATVVYLGMSGNFSKFKNEIVEEVDQNRSK